MKKALRYGLIGAAALGAGLVVLPFAIPTDIYKARIEASVSRATGRKFSISGPVRLTLFPVLGLNAAHVALANPPGYRAGALVAADELRIGVRFWPLLSGRIEATEILLERPRIALEVDAEGHGDWVLARTPQAAPEAGTPRAPRDAHLSGLKIVQGSVTYFNARTGHSRRVDGIDAQIAAAALDEPASATGTFVLTAGKVRFDAQVPAARALFEDRRSAIELALKSDLFTAAFGGTIAPDGSAAGRLRIDARRLRQAGDWLGLELPSGGGFQSLSLSTDVDSDDKHAALRHVTAVLDGTTITGDVTLDRSGKVPEVQGRLAIDRLDLNPYIASPPTRGAPPRERQTHDDGWSRDPISLDVLRKIDARLELDAGSLSVKHLKLGRTHLKVRLQGGMLRADLDPMILYGGRGKAALVVTAGPIAQFSDTLEFDGVALQPFLSDTIGVSQIAGTGTIKLDVVSRGNSADAIMHGLGGSGAIAFRDGQLRGVDLGQVARTIQALLGATEGKGAFTDYSSMSGSFTVADGVLASRDFQLAGPLIHTTGTGRVDVGSRTIDFRIVPRATASIAKIKLTVGVPFHIVGPWRHVRYKADLAGAAGVLLENLLGRHDANAPPPKKKHKSLGQALKNMLGIH